MLREKRLIKMNQQKEAVEKKVQQLHIQLWSFIDKL